MHGVLDRIEDGIAVVLIPEHNEEFTLQAKELPEGSTEGTWFTLVVENDRYEILAIDEMKTEEKGSDTASMQQKLTLRKRTSKFKRNT